MVKVKNVRPGILIIADAGLKLGPGEVADIGSLTPQAEKAIKDGLLARIDMDPESKQTVKVIAKSEDQSPGDDKQPEAQTPAEQKPGSLPVKSESGEVAAISSLTPQAEKAIEDGPLARVHSEPKSNQKAKVIAKGDELFLSDGKLPDAQTPAEQKPRLSQPVKPESGVKHGAG